MVVDNVDNVQVFVLSLLKIEEGVIVGARRGIGGKAWLQERDIVVDVRQDLNKSKTQLQVLDMVVDTTRDCRLC